MATAKLDVGEGMAAIEVKVYLMGKRTTKKIRGLSQEKVQVKTAKNADHEQKRAVKLRDKELQKLLREVTPTPLIDNGLSDEQKIEIISGHFKQIMTTLGLDLSNDSLAESPKRVAKMYVNEIFRGLKPSNFPKMTVIENEMKYDQMVVIRDVKIMSTCEHHFVTIHGAATIAYIPGKKVIGLSKINRIADYFSRRPQVQERLTKQIADCLVYVLETENVAVHINARHYCVISRGVEDSQSTTITSDLRGDFKCKAETRLEFLKHCTTKTLGFDI